MFNVQLGGRGRVGGGDVWGHVSTAGNLNLDSFPETVGNATRNSEINGSSGRNFVRSRKILGDVI